MDKWNAEQFIKALDEYIDARDEARTIPQGSIAVVSARLLTAKEKLIYQLKYVQQNSGGD